MTTEGLLCGFQSWFMEAGAASTWLPWAPQPRNPGTKPSGCPGPVWVWQPCADSRTACLIFQTGEKGSLDSKAAAMERDPSESSPAVYHQSPEMRDMIIQ